MSVSNPLDSCATNKWLIDKESSPLQIFKGIPFNIVINIIALLVCIAIHTITVAVTNSLRRSGKPILSMHRLTDSGEPIPTVWQCLTMTDRDIGKWAGLDGVAYLNAVINSTIQIVTFIPFLAFALPVYYIYGDSKSSFIRTTIMNLEISDKTDAWLLWGLTLSCMFFSFIWAAYRLRHAQRWPFHAKVCEIWNPGAHTTDSRSLFRSNFSGKQPECQCFLVNRIPNVLMLTDVPVKKEAEIQKELTAYFVKIMPSVAVQWIYLVRDYYLVARLEKLRTKLENYSQYCRTHFEVTGNRLKYQKACGGIQLCSPCSACCPCSSTDAIEFYSVRLNLTERALRDRYNSLNVVDTNEATLRRINEMLSPFTGIVFVGLRSPREALRVAKLFANPCHDAIPTNYTIHPETKHSSCRCAPRVHSMKMPFTKLNIAPPSSDIHWSNLMKTRHSSCFKRLGYVCTSIGVLILALLLTSPSYVLVVINLIHEVGNFGKNSGFDVPQWIPALLLVTASALVKQLVIISEDWAKHKTYDAREKTGQQRLFAFLVITVLIFPSLGVSGLPAIISRMGNPSSDGSQLRVECMFAPDSSVLFINYVITNALLGGGVLLLQVGRWCSFLLRILCNVHSLAEAYEAAQEKAGPFPFRERYATMCLVQTIVFTYAPIAPIILIFGLMYFCCDYMLCKYALVRIYEPYWDGDECGGMNYSETSEADQHIYHLSWSIQAIESSLTGVCLTCFTLLSFFSLRLTVAGIGIVTLAFFILFLIVVTAAVMFTMSVSKRWTISQCLFGSVPEDDEMAYSSELEEVASNLRMTEYSRF